jgi:hypothetical protein
MTIGHIIDRNLSESNNRDKDSRALDNLGGEGISNDISLFINNTNNKSIIFSNEYTISNGFIILNNSLLIPFSNRTQVIVDNIECIVRNSNFVDRFQLVRKSNNILYIPTGDIIRSDTIYLKDFELLNIERLPPTKPESDNSSSGILRGNTDNNTTNIYQSISLSNIINEIDQYISIYRFRKSKSIQLDIDNIINENLNISGSLLIEKLDNNNNPISTQTTLTNNDPGIFLYSNGVKIRAFSDSSNPWDTVSNAEYITTQSTKTTVIDLKVDTPNITGISTQLENGLISAATHKIPVTVNGEKYNLLCIL